MAIRLDVNGQARDAYHLNFLDPAKRLLKPNSTLTWTHSALVIQTNTSYSVLVDYGTAVNEADENNNFKSRHHSLDTSCRPDIRVSDLYLDEQCRLIVTLENCGTVRLPTEAWHPTQGVVVKLEKGGQNWLGFYLHNVDPGAHLMAPGHSIQVTYLAMEDDTSELIRAVADFTNVLHDGNGFNNAMARTLTCGPDGTPVDSGGSGGGGPALIIREIEAMDTLLTPQKLRAMEKTLSRKTSGKTKRPAQAKSGLSPALDSHQKTAALSVKKPVMKKKPQKEALRSDLSIEDIKSNKKGQVIVTIGDGSYRLLSSSSNWSSILYSN